MQSANLPLPNAVLRLIQGSLSMTDDQAGWIFTSYLAASAITMPIAQWLAGRYGLKLVYQAALAFFVLGLLLATQATTPLEFVGARIIQGLVNGDIATREACEIWRDVDGNCAFRHRQRPEHRWLDQ
jgi:DHA2 family multidrug resistance protein